MSTGTRWARQTDCNVAQLCRDGSWLRDGRVPMWATAIAVGDTFPKVIERIQIVTGSLNKNLAVCLDLQTVPNFCGSRSQPCLCLLASNTRSSEQPLRCSKASAPTTSSPSPLTGARSECAGLPAALSAMQDGRRLVPALDPLVQNIFRTCSQTRIVMTTDLFVLAFLHSECGAGKGRAAAQGEGGSSFKAISDNSSESSNEIKHVWTSSVRE
jgi:hypothetical protein